MFNWRMPSRKYMFEQLFEVKTENKVSLNENSNIIIRIQTAYVAVCSSLITEEMFDAIVGT